MFLTDWQCAPAAAGQVIHPEALPDSGLEWVSLSAPTTAAAAWRDAGRFTPGTDHDFDAEDWWFRTTVSGTGDAGSGDASLLTFHGLATLADIWWNGELVATSSNMFRPVTVDLAGQVRPTNELAVRVRSLRAELATRRPRPRWRTNLVDHQQLRWFRTALLGRTDAWNSAFAPVGPWLPVTFTTPDSLNRATTRVQATLDGPVGRVQVTVGRPGESTSPLHLHVDGAAPTQFHPDPDSALGTDLPAGFSAWSATAEVPDPPRWWPATHGEPALVAVSIVESDGTHHGLDPVGFRTVEFGPADAPVLRVNGVPVFVRGAVWSPTDPLALCSDEASLRTQLALAVAAGCNVMRLAGTTCFEGDAFHRVCDELGVMVWQDLMFGRLDYPVDDPDWLADAEREVRFQTARVAAHPSTVVLCGGSEVAQQAAMFGRPNAEEASTGTTFGPLVRALAPHVAFVLDSPSGGDRPFSVDAGVAHYFGVGGYLRPVEDARTTQVRFASECLAISNVPDSTMTDRLVSQGIVAGSPDWLRRVPRDRGAAWDFETVRDHYLAQRFNLDPIRLRAAQPERYLDLARATTAELIRDVVATWRAADHPCSGAIVLEWSDVLEGAGCGLVDSTGRPKPALAGLASALQPVAVTLHDVGMDGLDVWLHNDTATPAEGTLTIRVANQTTVVATESIDVTIAPRGSQRLRAETLLRQFLDITYAYRFGPPTADLVTATWELADGSQRRACWLRPGASSEPRDIGLTATAVPIAEHRRTVTVRSQELAQWVMIEGLAADTSDNWFHLEPAGTHNVELHHPDLKRIRVRAINSLASTSIEIVT